MLYLSPDVAEKFELTQKGISYYNNYYSNRFARIYFKFLVEPVTFSNSDRGIAQKVIYEGKLMNIEIQKVDVFDHESYLYNYIGTIK